MDPHMDQSAPAWTTEALLQHGEFVRRLARSLVVDEHEAEELVQETWVVALLKSPGRVEGLRPWLARVLRRLAFTRLRADLRRVAREECMRPAEAAPAAAREAEILELQQRVVASVLELPRPQKDVILLRHFRGLSLNEIAREVGAPLETVRSRLKRAHELLRASLDRDFGEHSLWCGALLALSESRSPIAAGAGAVGAGVIGGTIMGWKAAASVAVLVCVALVWWGVRDGDGLSSGAEADAPHDERGELPAAERTAELPRSEENASPRVDVGAGTPVVDRETPRAPGVWLVGRLVGDGLQAEELARITVDTSKRRSLYGRRERAKRAILPDPVTERLPVDQPFELDLTEIFERGELTNRFELVGEKEIPIHDPDSLPGMLQVLVDHDRFMPFERFLQLDPRTLERVRTEERVEIEATLQLRATAAVVEGRASIPPGVERRPLYAALSRFHDESRPWPRNEGIVTCDERGHFRLCVSHPGPFALLIWADESTGAPLRPETRILDLGASEHHLLPPIELAKGLVISGRVPPTATGPASGEVTALITGFEGREYPFHRDTSWLSMVWVDDAFELLTVSAPLDEEGRFLLSGLGPQLYSLRSSSSREAGSTRGAGETRNGIPVFRSERSAALSEPARKDLVRPPATGIELEVELGFAAFRLLADGEPLPDVDCRVLWTSTAEDSVLGMDRLRTDGEGRIIFAVDRDRSVEGRVTFQAPGRIPMELARLGEHLRDSGELQPLELKAIESPVHLWFHLELTDGLEAEPIGVALKPWPVGEPRPDQSEVGVVSQLHGLSVFPRYEDGAHHVDEIQPGRYWCTIWPRRSRQDVLRPCSSSFELIVPAMLDYHVEHRIGPGGHVRARAKAPEDPQRLRLEVYSPDGWQCRAVFFPGGDRGRQTTDLLDAGDYVLRAEAGGYETREYPFSVRHGEVTEIAVELVAERR